MCKNLNKEQIEATFKKFDQTGNDKLSFREFRDMMGKRSESKGKTVKQHPGSEQASSNGKPSGNTEKQASNTGEKTSDDAKQSGNKSGREAARSEKQAASSKQSCQQAKPGKEGDQANP